MEYGPKKIGRVFNCTLNKLKKESLYLFNSNIKGNINSDFGDNEEFLMEVKKQKLLKEKEELTKKIILSENNTLLVKKRL